MFLVFYPGQTKSSMIWDGVGQLVVGQHVPAGSEVVEWIPVNGDLDRDHYKLSGKSIIHEIPQAPAAPPPINLQQFNALFLQGYIEGLFSQAQVIDAEIAQKITDEQYRNAWLRGLIGNGSPEQQARLFEIAEECNIPLPQI